jgi:hypothetical protein
MRHVVIGAATAIAVSSLALMPTAGPTSLVSFAGVAEAAGGGAQARAATAPVYRAPRTADGKPNLNGIWQVLSTANWDLLPHSAQDGVPAGQGVVEGDEIPYQPSALAKKKQNFEKRKTDDPLTKCFLPGVPRITYVPFPFQISQTPKYVAITYEFDHATRIIYTDGSPHPPPLDFWMGDSRGRWDGDTLVVDVTHFNDETWFDTAGNYHSDGLHVVERYTPISPDAINYEATIEDPKVFSRPWKITMPLYRRLEKGIQLLEYECVDFAYQRVLRAGK